MNTDAIIELATAKVEIKYLTKNNDELKTIIAKLEAKIQELEADSPALADGQNSFLELADKFAPTINTLAEALINRFMPNSPLPGEGLSQLPAYSGENIVQPIKNFSDNKAYQKNSQKIAQQNNKQTIQRGSEEHYNFIRNQILNGSLEDENKINYLQNELSELQNRNPQLFDLIIQEFELNEDDESTNDIGENPFEEGEDAENPN
jgi:hypothetical protein